MEPVHEARDSALAPDLVRACTALWSATLSLMAAYMHTGAPAHRYLIARRIARNLATLHEQDCYTAECRATFSKLSRHWNDKADRHAHGQDRPPGSVGVLLPRLFHR
jgi:hypothetical protein